MSIFVLKFLFMYFTHCISTNICCLSVSLIARLNSFLSGLFPLLHIFRNYAEKGKLVGPMGER